MEGINLKKSKNISNYSQDDSVCYRSFLFIQQIFLKIIGLLPWAVRTAGIFRKNGSVENGIFECDFSHAGSCYNILLFFFLVAFNIYIGNGISSMETTSLSTLEIVLIELSFFTTLCISVIPLYYIIRQDLLIGVNIRLKNFDKKLNKCADYKLDINNSNGVIFTVNFIMTGCILIIRQFYYKDLVKVLIVSFPYFVGSFVIVQYAMFLNIIKTRFKSINSTLSKLGTPKSKISLSRESVIGDIAVIKRAYVELCEICDDTARFYGIPILVAIIILSMRDIFNLYLIISAIMGNGEFNVRLYQTGIFSVRNIFLFTVLTTYVTKIIKQNEKTATIISLIMDRYAMDDKIKEKLAKFSSDLWYLTVEFTACDIVPLDRTLLAVITGTIATYLVIVVQFTARKSFN
ncbi:putative gustatory receptor 28a isoform X3 [Microplitis mediator]|uniref:putative gustatory receptor 28a isoform X3 n=1 Tax=Microplitis mediator TaxID=375433 RepID=UPI00255742E8|nr:putative gustatory receptor 28a isoform X3 [Microplitis mediator]